MERSRIIPRLRPRPYDLRRKVLLKNFFREQMTYIPHIRSTVEISFDASNDSDFDENESNSNTNEGNILTPKKVQDNIVTSTSLSEPAPSSSNSCEKENSNNLESSSDETSSNITKVDDRASSKFSRLSRIIETIDSRLSRKNRRNCITKAKHELGSSKSILKPAGKKIIKDTEGTAKVKTKTFLERFKSRRHKKRNKLPTSKISHLFGYRNPSTTKSDSKVSTTSTQSVQTDISWSPDHYEKMKQSNISLLEENRLLSESLSSIISNTDFRSDSTHNSCCTDSYTNSSNNSVAYCNSEQTPLTLTNGNGSNSREVDFSGTRILRSKSMQNRNEKRSQASSRLRTRSFNCQYIKRPYNSDSFVANEPHRYKQEHYKVNPIASTIPVCTETRPSVLQNIDASPLYNTNTSSLLQTISNKSGKAIIRQSSMPERAYNWNNKARPVRSSTLRENDRHSCALKHISSHPKQSSRHRRSNTYNGYSSSVPFQDFPAEAFY